MIHIPDITGRRLVVATPMYGGECSGFYTQGMMQLSSLAATYGIRFSTIFLSDSLVTRARNRCVDIFKSIAPNPEDRLMFIDADIQFAAADVLEMFRRDCDVVGALYPLKQINWKRVKKIVQQHPDFDEKALQGAASDYVFNIKFPNGEAKGKIDVMELTPVRDLGTGFLMIRRKVFDKIEESGMARKYIPCANEEVFSGLEVYDHFPVGIDKDWGVGDEGAYLSEDWIFCRRWQKLGGEIYACPWIKLNHFGVMGFEGNMAALSVSGQKIGEDFKDYKESCPVP